MMYKLIKKRIDDQIHYFWLNCDSKELHGEELLTVNDAEAFFKDNLLHYDGPERRKIDFDRRWHLDRRKRISVWDRRENPAGRRWEDEIAFERKNLKTLNGK